ncbi:MAG: RHS repeat domain-containing protein [Candidatus Dormibacteraceae bacterium]
MSVGSSSTGYLYNALGQLIEKSTGSGANIYAYDEAGHLLGEYNGSGNLIEETVWLGDIPVATLQPNGSSVAINYVHTDQLNTPRKVTRSSDNALEWRIDQDSFGTASSNQNPGGLGTFVYNLRFPGQLYMVETGLNYNYARDYDPQVGRYIESDPIGLKGGISTYAYVHDNPVSFVDATGLVRCSRVYGLQLSDPRSPTPRPLAPPSNQPEVFLLCIYKCEALQQCPEISYYTIGFGWFGVITGCPEYIQDP